MQVNNLLDYVAQKLSGKLYNKVASLNKAPLNEAWISQLKKPDFDVNPLIAFFAHYAEPMLQGFMELFLKNPTNKEIIDTLQHYCSEYATYLK